MKMQTLKEKLTFGQMSSYGSTLKAHWIEKDQDRTNRSGTQYYKGKCQVYTYPSTSWHHIHNTNIVPANLCMYCEKALKRANKMGEVMTQKQRYLVTESLPETLSFGKNIFIADSTQQAIDKYLKSKGIERDFPPLVVTPLDESTTMAPTVLTVPYKEK